MVSIRTLFSVLAVTALAASVAHADFYIPLTWTRPVTTGTNGTFQGWETFSSPTGANAPQTVPGPAFGGAGSWSPINPGGTANVFDSSAPGNGSFVTSGGNIYSPGGTVTPQAVVPNNIDLTAGTNNSGWTTLIFQIRTQGNFLNIATGQLFDTSAPGVVYSPVSTAVTLNQIIPGGFGGFIREYWLQFQVPGNADVYQFNISTIDTSVSLDRFAVDTIWKPTAANQDEAFLEPTPLSAVPEPSTWALCGMTALIGGGVYYRRYRRQQLA